MAVYSGFRLEYDLSLDSLAEAARKRFVPMSVSEETKTFIEGCLEAKHGSVKTGLHRALSLVMSDFDVNALLGMYPMHLLDAEGLQRLVGDSPRRVLDVGAGNGDVTQVLAKLAEEVHVTEDSWAMRRLLRSRGFAVTPSDLSRARERFDLVSCLNVLDRTARPKTLLRQLSSRIAPGGKLLLSVPLPLDPFHFVGGNTRKPEEQLPVAGPRFEEALSALLRWLAVQLPELTLTAFTRVPYLSGGDAHRTLYVLDAVVLVLARGPDHSPTAQSTEHSSR
jgi:SAM-dependent methyltransferase